MLRDTLTDSLLRVLFVDADEELREALTGLLRSTTYVAAVGSAGEAFALLASEPFDAAIVDAGLDDGSGLALLEDLARTSPSTLRVLAVEDRPSALDDLTANGVVELQLAKPFGLPEVTALLEELRRRAPR